MNNKYSIQEGLESLDRIRLMMGYDMSKTFSENIFEQKSDYAMDRQSAAIMNAAGITSDREYKERVKDINDTYNTKIDAPSVPELLDKAREFFFTPGGMAAQIFLSIAGAEIGLPVVFEILDIAIVINDFMDMNKNWKSTPSNIKTFKDWFLYQWEQNRGFQKVIEDILILLTGGVIKILGKGAKEAYIIFKNKLGGKTFKFNFQTVKKLIQSKKSLINELPSKIKDWANKKVSELEKGIKYLESAPKEAVKGIIEKSPSAAIKGGVAYLAFKGLEYKMHKWTDSGLDTNLMKNLLIANNPFLYNQVVYLSNIPDGENPSIKWNYARTKNGTYGFFDDENTWIPFNEEQSKQIIVIFVELGAFNKVKMNVEMVDPKKGIIKINGKKYQRIGKETYDWRVKEIVESKTYGQGLSNLTSDASSWAF